MIIYGDTNAKKSEKNSGGGVQLNLEYSLTPPIDERKTWIRTEATPEDIEIQTEDRVVITNDKVLTTQDANQNVYAEDGYAYCYYNNRIYVQRYISYNYYFYAYNLDGTIYKNQTTANYNLPEKSTCKKLWIYNNTMYALINSKIYTIDPENFSNYQLIYTAPLNQIGEIRAIAEDNGMLYIVSIYGSGNSAVPKFTKYNYLTNQCETTNMPTFTGYTYSYYVYSQACVINNKFYFATSSGSASYNSSSYATLYSYNLSTDELSVEFTWYFQIPNGSRTAAPTGAQIGNLGNKIVISSGWYNWSGDGHSRQYMDNRAIQYNVDTKAKNTFALPGYASNQFLLEDKINNKIILAYGYTNTAWTEYGGPSAYIKKVWTYSYTATLTENKLLLTSDGTGKEVPIIREQHMEVDIKIQNAWIGNSNNIAELAEMYFNKDNAWWGVNCEDWNRIKSASISVPTSQVSMNTEATNTQTYTATISSVTHNNTPEYEVVAESEDTAVCSAAVNTTNDTLTITTTAERGLTNVILKIVDNYGSEFKQIISVNTLGFYAVYTIGDVAAGTTLTQSINCKIGDLIIASVIARDSGNETASEGWTLLGRSTTQALNQTLAFYYKIATATTESLTITQSSSARIYISLIALTGKTTATMGSFVVAVQSIGASITLPNKDCIVSASCNLWNTATETARYVYEGTTQKISVALPANVQGRLESWIDYGGGGVRTITPPITPDSNNQTTNDEILGYVIIE